MDEPLVETIAAGPLRAQANTIELVIYAILLYIAAVVICATVGDISVIVGIAR